MDPSDPYALFRCRWFEVVQCSITMIENDLKLFDASGIYCLIFEVIRLP